MKSSEQQAISGLLDAFADFNVRSATKYIASNLVFRATRRVYRGKVFKGGNLEVVLTIGRPNYIERKFIKLCKKAGEPFPVKKIQLKYLPKLKVIKK